MVRISRVLLGEAKVGISKTLSEILVCPLSKQPLRVCDESGKLVCDELGISFPIVDGIPCLVPMDGQILDSHGTSKASTDSGSTDKEGAGGSS